MRVERFEELRVWQKSKDFSLQIYRASAAGGFGRDFGLRDQIRRAAVSVMSNIAEGFDRYSRAEFRHYLSLARGSAAEVRSQLHLALDLGYLPAETHAVLAADSLELSRLLAALRASIRPR